MIRTKPPQLFIEKFFGSLYILYQIMRQFGRNIDLITDFVPFQYRPYCILASRINIGVS